ncbi:protein of unknown function [Bradyrhizobium vignae]|uniref:Uncharacterized protein n=1 Tax=Bradyrhizobium vignae TaxID=1549949 RepID=A0A2U3PUC1_9BRAD|nr:protein of unknown function [Bradyrhizobium vignae]
MRRLTDQSAHGVLASPEYKYMSRFGRLFSPLVMSLLVLYSPAWAQDAKRRSSEAGDGPTVCRIPFRVCRGIYGERCWYPAAGQT